MNDEELMIVTNSNDNHIFRLQNFEALEKIIPQVAMEACQGMPNVLDLLYCWCKNDQLTQTC